MFWKLVEDLEFDGNFAPMVTRNFFGAVMARNKKEAEKWFTIFNKLGLIEKPATAYVTEATEEEYANFLYKYDL